jgi:hypothetical protein
MVRCINSNGLCLSTVKLNGTLELRFTTDTSFGIQHIMHGMDMEDNLETEEACEAATGIPIVSLGLEMFLEGVDGVLEVRFEGDKDRMLALQYDGCDSEDIVTQDEKIRPGLSGKLDGFLGRLGPPGAQLKVVGATHGSQTTLSTTRDLKILAISRKIRSAKPRTIGALVHQASVQTQSTSMFGAGVQPETTADSPTKEKILFFPFMDLTEQDNLTLLPEGMVQGHISHESKVSNTFTKAVATIFQTSNEPRDLYRPKRQAEPAADYRTYKHIFIEGYRNGDGKEEEGRLHVHFHHHVLLWESYEDYEGGTKLTLDRLNLARCKPFSLDSDPTSSTNIGQTKSSIIDFSTVTTSAITGYSSTGRDGTVPSSV